MTEEFLDVWNGHPGYINAAKIRNKLTPGVVPVHSAPYQAGTKFRKFHHIEIDQTFE